jgi:hypothetical protein
MRMQGKKRHWEREVLKLKVVPNQSENKLFLPFFIHEFQVDRYNILCFSIKPF